MKRAIILAAGQGKRMKSELPKVLHEVCGRTMLWYVVRELRRAKVDDITLVASDLLATELQGHDLGELRIVIQEQALGTGHAVRVALDALPVHDAAQMLVVSADMPLLHAGIFDHVFAQLDAQNVMSLTTVIHDAHSNFGRIVRAADGSIERIVERRDCSDAEAAIDEMNAGCYAFDEAALRKVILALKSDNAQQEYYLTDTLSLLRADLQRIAAVKIGQREQALGVNDRVELAIARKAMNARLCEEYMHAGVTIIDPATTYLEPELKIGRDTVIYPNTMISRLSVIGEHCVLGPNTRLSYAKIGAKTTVRESVITESIVGENCSIGPFVHLRMQTVVGNDVRFGNFVESKHSRVADGVRAGHLSYIGDADIGEGVNIGAGTVTCNYDGKQKHTTTIKKGAFIGSNSSLIAPLTIGEGALTGAGSVVTKDVPDAGRVVGNPARPLVAAKVS